ncbi:MAG: adenine-specific methyltransferase EcoRI family protein [Hyphomonadaceae bacterium]|nr:adenine-specific methyltransferase EcoRI family protein [Hyphomonadaceae bacterium]MBC6411597.1 adenine-specific methyltransferase EcoRI family protein [Hyphomonadaceae bacterium]
MNTNLAAARKSKNDEFYTQLGDIESELRHYRPHFEGKVVYCNCDDPRVSNFFHYFSHNFTFLGLKKLITTCYRNREPSLFSRHDTGRAILLEYDGLREGDVTPRAEDIGITYLKGDGDFRSRECIGFLKEADIVATNPPFSLFREYMAQLMEYDSRFIILGNMNAITYKEVFPLIKENRLWYGPSISSGDRTFGVPDHYPLDAATAWIDGDGNRFIKVKGVRWFTNLDHDKRHEDLILYRRYTPEDYPHYDNYDAIDVSRTRDIPMDWSGAMGVPITFLDKYNPDQFEIIGMDHDVKAGLLPHIPRPGWTGKIDRGYIQGKRQYARILIRNRIPRP